MILLGVVGYVVGWFPPSAERSIGAAGSSTDSLPSSTSVPIAAMALPSSTSQAPATFPVDQDLVGDEPSEDECVITATSVRLGDTGDDVICLQRALGELGYFNGEATGVFDDATAQAVTAAQRDRGLFVDGVVGRETALSLEVWPDESMSVVRTPAPADGAVDALGYPLSSVASSGGDAPPLPSNSGSGRRLVYQRAGQRVWAVADDESIIRSWLISGSKYDNETPGIHEVYSRSEMSTAWNGQAWLPMMVRWLKTDIGAIGFHALPLHVEDDSPYQTEAELGTRLSGGCQRQANLDAQFTWDFAQIGTKVVVI
jgi:peptidoglycan hydrolase-like protein with peptidoglycan-binding domain